MKRDFFILNAERSKMTFSDFLKLVTENKEYAPLYSALVATLALIFSVLSFIFSNIVSKKRSRINKKISDVRYEEQRKQYEKRLDEERKRREEDKFGSDEKIRLSEKPRLVFKNSKVKYSINSEEQLLCMEFVNKGRDTAYDIIPDVECIAKKIDMTEFVLCRCEAVQDPVVMVGETFSMTMKYDKKEIEFFRMTFNISFKDASLRKYKQTFIIDIYNELGNGLIINYAQPELSED